MVPLSTFSSNNTASEVGRQHRFRRFISLTVQNQPSTGLASLAGGGGQDRSKSSGGAWGSFTTIKAASSSSLASSGGNFWSREENDDAAEYGLDGDPTCLKRPAAVVGSAKPKKFFKSRDGNRCRNSSGTIFFSRHSCLPLRFSPKNVAELAQIRNRRRRQWSRRSLCRGPSSSPLDR